MTELFSLIDVYQLNIVAAILGGGSLALIGSQLAARHQVVQTLVISQAANLGVVLGLALKFILYNVQNNHNEYSDHQWTLVLPLILSFGCAFLFYTVCEWMIPAHWTSRNTYYIGLYAILLSLAYGIISLVPGLEGHMTATYFGDIATASHYEAGFMILMGMLGLLFFLFYWKKITAYSFNLSLFGFSINSHDTHNYNHLFIFLSQLTIAASVLFLGLLFTLLCLFLPILILVRFQQGFKSLAVKLILSAALGVGTGIIFSLWQGTLPTVSCIALGIVICSFGTAVKNTHH